MEGRGVWYGCSLWCWGWCLLVRGLYLDRRRIDDVLVPVLEHNQESSCTCTSSCPAIFPWGRMRSGSWSGWGFQPWWLFVKRVSIFSSESHCNLTKTLPGVAEEKMRWCSDEIPSTAPLLKYGWTGSAPPSHTIGHALSDSLNRPAGHGWYGLTDQPHEQDHPTTRARSSKHPTSDFLNFCFSRPKHQSGANFVWLTFFTDSCSACNSYVHAELC